MKKSIIFLFFIVLINNRANADCYTGFACSINELEEQENLQLQKDINTFKKYLKKIKRPHKFRIIGNNNTEYQDLFVFKSVI